MVMCELKKLLMLYLNHKVADMVYCDRDLHVNKCKVADICYSFAVV